MSDIHVLEGQFKKNKSGIVRLVFHVDVPQSSNYPADNTRESEVPNLETDDNIHFLAIRAGTVFESVENYPINADRTNGELVAEIKMRWHIVQTKVTAMINNNYKFYGQTLSRSV